jgi:hypothetical protein
MPWSTTHPRHQTKGIGHFDGFLVPDVHLLDYQLDNTNSFGRPESSHSLLIGIGALYPLLTTGLFSFIVYIHPRVTKHWLRHEREGTAPKVRFILAVRDSVISRQKDEFETEVSNRRTLVRGHRSSSSDSSDLSASFNLFPEENLRILKLRHMRLFGALTLTGPLTFSMLRSFL